MLRRLTQVLIVFMVAFAATMPISVRAMPMVASMTGPALQQGCQGCLQHQPRSAQPDGMLACPMLGCAGSFIAQPSVALVPTPTSRRIAGVKVPVIGWAEAALIPDPFPPRPIVLL